MITKNSKQFLIKMSDYKVYFFNILVHFDQDSDNNHNSIKVLFLIFLYSKVLKIYNC